MNKLTYDDVINRIGFFRNKANLSARETSLRLGYSEQFVKRIENKSVELKVSTLLAFLTLLHQLRSFFLSRNELQQGRQRTARSFRRTVGQKQRNHNDAYKKLEVKNRLPQF